MGFMPESTTAQAGLSSDRMAHKALTVEIASIPAQ
jgi:hypothetical protein